MEFFSKKVLIAPLNMPDSGVITSTHVIAILFPKRKHFPIIKKEIQAVRIVLFSNILYKNTTSDMCQGHP